jgi:hypothetical protein
MTRRTKKAWRRWRKLVSEQQRSGQTVAEFCHERDLCRPYFFLWKKRLRERATPKFSKFLEVQVAEPTPSVSDDSRIEVRLRNGRSLVVGRGCDAEQVRALLAVVESAG